MNHLRFLSYVDEVARVGSIRQAADRLHIAPSAVNRRILDIEEELGTPLFERLPRGVRLTAAGELFVAYIRSRPKKERSADRPLFSATDGSGPAAQARSGSGRAGLPRESGAD